MSNISKASILRPLVQAAIEQEGSGFNRKTVLTQAENKLRDDYPPEERRGVTFNRDDISRMLYEMKHRTAQTKSVPLSKGKVNKTEILKPIIEQAMKEGKELDYKKLRLIGQKKMEQTPAKLRQGVEVTLSDVRTVTRLLREKYGKTTAAPAAAQKTTELMTWELFSLDEMKAAKDLLSKCQGQKDKAVQLLNLIEELTGN